MGDDGIATFPTSCLVSDGAAMTEVIAQAGECVTHRCIAIVDVPPCQPVPEVAAAVEEAPNV